MTREFFILASASTIATVVTSIVWSMTPEAGRPPSYVWPLGWLGAFIIGIGILGVLIR